MTSSACRARDRTGSVLMETLLVLPLLLLLFGGLFVVGDILHGRLHLLTVDRVAAWSPQSRFDGRRKDLFQAWFPHLRLHTALHLEEAFTDFYDGGSSKPTWVLRNDSAVYMPGGLWGLAQFGGKTLRGTEWLDFAGGRAYSHVEVPIWAHMANTQAVMNRSDRGGWLASDWRLQAHDGSLSPNGGEFREFNRAYLLRRMPDGAVQADFVRGRPVTKLEWFAIPLGSWPGEESGSTVGKKLSVVRPRRPFSRHPTAVAMGEF